MAIPALLGEPAALGRGGLLEVGGRLGGRVLHGAGLAVFGVGASGGGVGVGVDVGVGVCVG